MADEPELVALWSAVSDEEQAQPGLPSLDEQERMGREHALTCGDRIVRVLRAEGFSRFEDFLPRMMEVCPVYAEMVDLIERQAITKVICSRYDRLWRTPALQAQLCALADSRDVWLFSLQQPIQRGAEQTAMWVRAISGLTAEQEVRNIVDNLRRGLRGRVHAGKTVAHSQRPYGYRIVGSGRDRALELVPEERFAVEWVMRRRAEGAGYLTIAAELNQMGYRNPKHPDGLWTLHLVRYMVHNPVYAGYVRMIEYPRRPKAPRREKVVHIEKGLHEPIISEALWQQVQRINNSRARDYTYHGRPCHLLTGLVRCGLCGDAMIYRPMSGGGYYLDCARYRRYRGPRSELRPLSCERFNGYSVRVAHRYVLDWLKGVLDDPAAWARACRGSDGQTERERRIAAIDAEIAGISMRRTNLLESIEMARSREDREALLRRYEDWGRVLAERQAEREELIAIDARIDATEHMLLSYRDLASRLEEMPVAKLRPVLRQLIDRIVLIQGEPPTIYLAGHAP